MSEVRVLLRPQEDVVVLTPVRIVYKASGKFWDEEFPWAMARNLSYSTLIVVHRKFTFSIIKLR